LSAQTDPTSSSLHLLGWGAVVRIPVRPNGAAGTPAIAATDPALVTADGVAFDAAGRPWVAVNSGALVAVSRSGVVATVVADPACLDYPVQPAFGMLAPGRTSLDLVNGSFDNGTPNLVSFRVGVGRLKLP
jgi:hypothetical protein